MVGFVIFFSLLLDVSNPFLGGVFAFEREEPDDPVHRVSTRVGIAVLPARVVSPALTVPDARSTFERPAARSICYAALLTVCLGHRDRGGADSAPPPEDVTASLITLA